MGEGKAVDAPGGCRDIMAIRHRRSSFDGSWKQMRDTLSKFIVWE